MKILTVDAKITCKHLTGVVNLFTLQNLVYISDRPVMVQNDPEAKPITGCCNVGPTIKPCTLTLKVEKGYSDLVFIDRRPVCLDILTGLTDGTPPGSVKYVVRVPGQNLVEEVSGL